MQFVLNNWYLFLALIVIVALILASPAMQLIYRIKSVSPAQTVLLMNRESATLVDVSEPSEFKAGHIPNAVNAPLSKFEEHLKPLEKYKQKPVVVSCRSGNRSMKAAVVLRKRGFASVYALAGGLTAWERDHLPLEK